MKHLLIITDDGEVESKIELTSTFEYLIQQELKRKQDEVQNETR